eukprot:jgi/Tetstr1/458180/TSEL_044671.t1
MSDWLSTAVRIGSVAPPTGTSWSSHNLLKGAAAAANAIGVPLSHIRYPDGWATSSDVVLDFIDPNILPSHGAWFFFGHMSRPSATSKSNKTPQRSFVTLAQDDTRPVTLLTSWRVVAALIGRFLRLPMWLGAGAFFLRFLATLSRDVSLGL